MTQVWTRNRSPALLPIGGPCLFCPSYSPWICESASLLPRCGNHYNVKHEWLIRPRMIYPPGTNLKLRQNKNWRSWMVLCYVVQPNIKKTFQLCSPPPPAASSRPGTTSRRTSCAPGRLSSRANPAMLSEQKTLTMPHFNHIDHWTISSLRNDIMIWLTHWHIVDSAFKLLAV